MDLGLEGRRALVCGASKGLGFAVAEALVREGAQVIVNSRNEGSLRSAAEQLETRTGKRAGWLAADLTQPDQREQLFARSVEAMGGVDLLLINAGGPPPGPFESHTQQSWRLAIELALGCATHLCALALPAMKDRRFGRIAQIGYVNGYFVL